jgi:hypothetical protein
VKEYYLFVVTRQHHALFDCLDSAGISSEYRKGQEKHLPAGELFVGNGRGKLRKGKLWLMKGWMDPATEPRLKDLRGIYAWHRLEIPSRDREKAPMREVVLNMLDTKWVATLATLMSHGFHPIKERDDSAFNRYGTAVTTMHIATSELYIHGHTSLSEEEIMSLTQGEIIDVWDVQAGELPFNA